MLMLMLDLRGKVVTIFGAGNVGTRKVSFFTDSGAKVHVIGEDVSEDIRGIEGISVTERKVDEDMAKALLDETFIVVLATNDTEFNRTIAKYARQKGILANVVDDPVACDVYFPSLVQRGSLVIGIGTSGASPSLSRFTRERIEEAIGPEFALMAEVHEEVRNDLKKWNADMHTKRALLRRILDNEEIWALLKEGRTSEAKELAIKVVGQ